MSYQNVSVILTTYNGAAYIKKQLDSILKQTVLPAEIIICDDRSTDNTVAIIDTYLTNTLIKLYVNKERLGIVANFKKAAQLAKPGNPLVFADQDDLWVPQKLQILAEALNTIDDGVVPALIYSDLAVIDKDDRVIAESFWAKQQIDPDKVRLQTLVYGNVVTGCTMMINYPMAIEFFEMDNTGFLHDEWLALIAYTFGKAKLLKDKLVLYRQHAGNITFSEDYEQTHINENSELMKYIWGEKKFLPHQFNLAKAFFFKYRQRLNDKQTNVFERFIALENKNYLLQRLNRRIAYL